MPSADPLQAITCASCTAPQPEGNAHWQHACSQRCSCCWPSPTTISGSGTAQAAGHPGVPLSISSRARRRHQSRQQEALSMQQQAAQRDHTAASQAAAATLAGPRRRELPLRQTVREPSACPRTQCRACHRTGPTDRQRRTALWRALFLRRPVIQQRRSLAATPQGLGPATGGRPCFCLRACCRGAATGTGGWRCGRRGRTARRRAVLDGA